MADIIEKLIRLPMEVMISSMKAMTRTMQEIQHKSESRDGGAHRAGKGAGKDAGRASALGSVPQMAITPLFEMYKIPASGLVSGIDTISQAMRNLRQERAAANGIAVTEVVAGLCDEVIPLDEKEAAMEQGAILPETPDASFGITLWEIGRPGRSDYAGKWTATFDYRVGQDTDPAGSPRMPHLLAVRDGSKSNGATESLNIHFTLERGYAAGELAMTYDRWGGEKDRVCVDDKLLAPVRGAGRGRLRHVSLLLDEISPGTHVLTFTTSGDTTSKEHRIDCVRLAEVEPHEQVE